MFNKIRISRKRRDKLTQQIIEAQVYFGGPKPQELIGYGHYMDVIGHLILYAEFEKPVRLRIEPNYSVLCYLIPIAYKEYEGSRKETEKDGIVSVSFREKVVYMIIRRNRIEYVIDKCDCYVPDKNKWFGTPMAKDGIVRTNHVYTLLPAAEHALCEEVCDNWPGEWRICKPTITY